ncbi:MAG: Ku protein [Planctomycetes bacterium]|nr:Ku protein [Planctomycetota bacterium]
MTQVVWKGHLSFGLITIGVALHPAEKRDELDFVLLDRRDNAPVGHRRVNKKTGAEVPAKDVVRGFEYESGRFVVLEEAELKRASPGRAEAITLVAFVDGGDIDPAYYDRPYYVEPTDRNSKSYVLLREALKRAGKFGLAKIVIRTREHLAALVPRANFLVLNLLRYKHELKDPGGLKMPPESDLSDLGITYEELRTAERLIQAMTESWDPDRYRDDFRDEVLRMIRTKAQTGTAAPGAAPAEERKETAEVLDLSSLLKRSIEQAAERAKEAHRRPKTA